MLLSWNTTRECNLYCRHCYRDAGEKGPDELSTAEGCKLIKEIARAGFKILIFSGGEPLLRSDIYHLIAHARAQGLRPVLGTNGTLITPAVARELKAAGASGVGISLDSLDVAHHNRLRASEDAWERAVAGMEACREAGLSFQIHTTVFEWNDHEVEALTDFAVKMGAVAHHVFFLVPAGRGEDLEKEALERKRYELLLRRILAKQREVDIELKPTCAPQFMRIARQTDVPMRFSKGCLAGTAYCCILPNGDVHPCPYLPLKLDNVREKPFDEIWRTNPVFNTLRENKLEGKCGGCSYAGICGGCRARAYYYHNGSIMAEDPWCLYRGA